MEELKAEIEKLEEKMIQEELNKKLDLVRVKTPKLTIALTTLINSLNLIIIQTFKSTTKKEL